MIIHTVKHVCVLAGHRCRFRGDRIARFFGGKMFFHVPMQTWSWLQLSCYWIPAWTWSKSCFSPPINYLMFFRKFQKVGTGKDNMRNLPSLPTATFKEQNDLYFRRMCLCSKNVIFFLKWSLFKQLKYTPTPYASTQSQKSLLYIMHSTFKWHLLFPGWKITVSICI